MVKSVTDARCVAVREAHKQIGLAWTEPGGTRCEAGLGSDRAGDHGGVPRTDGAGIRSDSRPGCWIVINTHPHRERMALENLQRQSFAAYCPMMRSRRSHARQVEMVLRPLFPSYLFVRVEPQSTRWRPILSTYGVKTVVRAGEQLSFIHDAFVGSLRAREIDGAVVRPAHPYRVGDKVQIAAGPFDGIVSTILELDEKDRLMVLVKLMNRAVKVQLHSTSVTPLHQQ